MNSESRLTRREVAARLGVSVSSVRRLEGVRLHPTQDEAGIWRFDAAELASIAVRPRRKPRRSPRRRPLRSGDVAARIFRMFGQRMSLRDIVVAARQPPELVRVLYREWLLGLADGERDRCASEAHERQRREQLEDDRMSLEQLRIFRG